MFPFKIFILIILKSKFYQNFTSVIVLGWRPTLILNTATTSLALHIYYCIYIS